MSDDTRTDPDTAALHAAVDELREMLDAVIDGSLAAEEFRRRAVRTGIVFDDDGAWIINLKDATWHRFDGISLVTVPADRERAHG